MERRESRNHKKRNLWQQCPVPRKKNFATYSLSTYPSRMINIIGRQTNPYVDPICKDIKEDEIENLPTHREYEADILGQTGFQRFHLDKMQFLVAMICLLFAQKLILFIVLT